jgi:hypothetical protein
VMFCNFQEIEAFLCFMHLGDIDYKGSDFSNFWISPYFTSFDIFNFMVE